MAPYGFFAPFIQRSMGMLGAVFEDHREMAQLGVLPEGTHTLGPIAHP